MERKTLELLERADTGKSQVLEGKGRTGSQRPEEIKASGGKKGVKERDSCWIQALISKWESRLRSAPVSQGGQGRAGLEGHRGRGLNLRSDLDISPIAQWVQDAVELGWGLPWARSDALHSGSRMEEAGHGATRLQQCREPRSQDTMRAVRGLTGGKEGQLPERGLGGFDGIV